MSGGGMGGAGGAGGNDTVYDAAGNVPPHLACPLWTLVDTANPEDPTVTGGVLTLATSDDSEIQYYFQSGAAVITPPTLIIEAEVKLISGSSSNATRAPIGIGFTIDTDFEKNVLYIADGEIFILTGENTKGASANVATTDDFHIYRIEVNTTSGVVTVFRDNVQVLTGATFTDPSNTENRVRFGPSSTLANGVSEWKMVRHNARGIVACP